MQRLRQLGRHALLQGGFAQGLDRPITSGVWSARVTGQLLQRLRQRSRHALLQKDAACAKITTLKSMHLLQDMTAEAPPHTAQPRALLGTLLVLLLCCSGVFRDRGHDLSWGSQ